MKIKRTPDRQTAQTSRADEVKNGSRTRKKSRHKKNAIIYTVLILLVVAAGIGVSFTLIFNTTEIVVENSAERYSNDAIINASGISVGDNMPSMNTAKIAKKIEKELPYIGRVTIKRGLTGTVTISVEYTRAVMFVPDDTGYVLMNSSGKVLETGVAEPADYIAEIIGAEIKKAVAGETAVFTDDGMFTYVTELVSDFEDAGFKNLTMLDFSDITAVIAQIDYRITVKLGPAAKAASKLKFGKSVIDDNLENVASGEIIVDLTQNGKAYVRSRDNIEAASEAMSKAAEESLSSSLTEGESVPDTTAAGGADEVSSADNVTSENTAGNDVVG